MHGLVAITCTTWQTLPGFRYCLVFFFVSLCVCFQPKKLFSPTYVMCKQEGSCFEYSVLLCSLLIGMGYDAYCVCGYATREVCLMDQGQDVCPLLKGQKKVSNDCTENVTLCDGFCPPQNFTLQDDASAEEQTKSKYVIRPPKDLTSKFRLRQRQKELDKVAAEEKKKKDEEAARIAVSAIHGRVCSNTGDISLCPCLFPTFRSRKNHLRIASMGSGFIAGCLFYLAREQLLRVSSWSPQLGSRTL